MTTSNSTIIMKLKLSITFAALLFSLLIHSQGSVLVTDVKYFIDNTEFKRSTVQHDQTMSGTQLQTVLNLKIDRHQSINAGINLLMLAGGIRTFETPAPIAYYHNDRKNIQLLAGAFPRNKLLENYSNFFFQDSVLNYRPIMHGIFWETRENKNRFFNFWLDWTGMQDELNNESFFVGTSAQYGLSNFFAGFQSYMFHYAYPKTMVPGYFLCDNFLTQVELGYKIKQIALIEKFRLSGGVLFGYERERDGLAPAHMPIGLVAKLEVEHKYLGIESQLYLGDKRQVLYPKYGNRVYWNNSFLRAGNYLENKLFFKLVNNRVVNAKLSLNIHLSEGQIFHEQVLTVHASVDKILGRTRR